MGAESGSQGFVIPPRYWAWLGTRRGLAAVLWVLTAVVGGYLLWHSLVWFNDSSTVAEEWRRVDGNNGHAQIDFGGQWVMGRMLVEGHGRQLYHRQRQWEVVREGFRVSDEPRVHREESCLPKHERKLAKPEDDLRHDAERLLYWFMGSDPPEWKTVGGAVAALVAQEPLGNPLNAAAVQFAAQHTVTPELIALLNEPAIGGPLYPPIHAFLYAPFGAFDRPQTAYHVFQVFAALAVPVAGLGVKVLTRGRVWWSAATLVLFLYPGTLSALDLGQNPTITVGIVIWGWALASRGYAAAGGAVWGLLAFKPVWGLAFFLVPVLMRRWRFCSAMVVTGGGLVLATVPFVGVQTWFDWLQVGKEASALYNVNYNWIHLSRDLQSVPRRMMHDFNLPAEIRDKPLTQVLAWALWGAVFSTTAVISLRFGDCRRFTGIGAGFLFFGAYLTCYRFMYYDALLSAVGCAVLFAEPTRFLRTRTFTPSEREHVPGVPSERRLPAEVITASSSGPRLVGYVNSFPLTVLVVLLLVVNALRGLQLEATFGIGYYAQVTSGADGTTGIATPRLAADTGTNYPWETFLVLLLWLWCGWRLIRGEETPPPRSRIAAEGVQGSTDVG